MSGMRPGPPLRVPTLTEVVEPLRPPPPPALVAAPPFEAPLGATPPPPDPVLAADIVPEAPAPRGEPQAVIDETALIERILADLQRQVDLMLEYRMREVLAPALARATESLVRDARGELASTLRDVVSRAVAQELLRHRGR